MKICFITSGPDLPDSSYKIFFKLISAEDEIQIAHKYQKSESKKFSCLNH